MAERRLLGLDALRGVAALVVLGHHLDQTFGIPGNWHLGAIAVDLFFVISGFVMARTYETRMREGLTAPTFMAIRVKRLWPIFAFGTSLGLIVLVLLGTSPRLAIPAFVLALLFLPAPFIGNRSFPVNGPGWSLFFELVANGLHAVALAKMSNRMLLVFFVSCAVAYGCSIVTTGDVHAPTPGYWLDVMIRTFAMYSAGVLMWRYDACRLPVPFLPSLMAFPILVLITPASWSLGLVAICPVLVIGAARAQVQGRVFVRLGLLSYPLYAVHRPILDLSPDPFTATILSIGAAVMVVMLLERPRRQAMISIANEDRAASRSIDVSVCENMVSSK